ncbi:MAG: PilN domain-containing protein [Desulfobulbaceae bacterium]|nr:PilN domain-containing protein [Desulfobulbaceae bacterium]
MVYINLLPIKKIKQHAKAVQQLTLFAVCFVFVLAVLGVVGLYQASTAANLEKEITVLNAEKQRYEKILAQIKKLEQDKKLIESKIAVINTLKKTSALTVHVLDEIANLTPTKRLWLNSLNQSGMSLSISGMALDNQTIASYMDELKTSPYIAEVNLISSSLQAYAGRNLKSFNISCAISVPGTAEPESSPQTQQQ